MINLGKMRHKLLVKKFPAKCEYAKSHLIAPPIKADDDDQIITKK
jgi:hypothetical protein